MRPRLDRSALVFGAVFVVVGAGVLLDELGAWDIGLGLLLPAAVVAAGLALMIGALVGEDVEE